MTLSIFDDVNFSLGFDLISLSLPLSLAPHLPLHNQQKWDYPEKERERKRVKKKKSWCVYGRVKLFEPGGFRPKIDSLQAARLVIIDQEGRVANSTLITHGDCLLRTEHQNSNANGWLPPFCVVRNLEGH